MDYMKFAAQDKYVASVQRPPPPSRPPMPRRPTVKGYEPGGDNAIFREYTKKFAVLRPETPGYPFIATGFTKTAQDILNGADAKKALDQLVKDIDANQESNNYFE